MWLRSLHYAVVALGTPNVTFLVALDTGSDLLWVPCDCVKCAPLSSPNYGVRASSSSSSTPLFFLCLLVDMFVMIPAGYLMFVTIRVFVAPTTRNEIFRGLITGLRWDLLRRDEKGD